MALWTAGRFSLAGATGRGIRNQGLNIEATAIAGLLHRFGSFNLEQARASLIEWRGFFARFLCLK